MISKGPAAGHSAVHSSKTSCKAIVAQKTARACVKRGSSRRKMLPLLLCSMLLLEAVWSFSLRSQPKLQTLARPNRQHTTRSKFERYHDLYSTSVVFSPSQEPKLVMNPFTRALSNPVSSGLALKIKGLSFNPWAVFYGLATVFTAVLVLPFMALSALLCDIFGDRKRRTVLDWFIHGWARMAMIFTFSGTTKVFGAENLPKIGASRETVMYVPNHTTFFDILLLSGYLRRPFKYLSKSEIKAIPIVGLGMMLAQHVFLKRNDIKSTFEVTDSCIQKLKDGNSMVLFAEGTRSPDGKLKPFKKGAFQMAKQAGVKVVPVSIGHVHRYMPRGCVLPLSRIRHTYIKVHPAIDTHDKSVKDIKNLCFQAVNSGLPPYQKFVDTAKTGSSVSSSSGSSIDTSSGGMSDSDSGNTGGNGDGNSQSNSNFARSSQSQSTPLTTVTSNNAAPENALIAATSASNFSACTAADAPTVFRNRVQSNSNSNSNMRSSKTGGWRVDWLTRNSEYSSFLSAVCA